MLKKKHDYMVGRGDSMIPLTIQGCQNQRQKTEWWLLGEEKGKFLSMAWRHGASVLSHEKEIWRWSVMAAHYEHIDTTELYISKHLR